MPKIPSRPELDLSGKWIVAELPTMMDDYLDITNDPHVLIKHTEPDTFTASFQFGAQSGDINGHIDEVGSNYAALFFTFLGEDEGDEISGASPDAAYHSDEDQITGTMRYHNGDDMPFVWKRAQEPKPKITKGKKKS